MSTSAVACPDQQGRVHHAGCGDPLGVNVLRAAADPLELDPIFSGVHGVSPLVRSSAPIARRCG